MDQFYTKNEVAQKCFEIFCSHCALDVYDTILEPSAGKGAFFTLFPEDKRTGMDIDPKCDGVLKGDFLEFMPQPDKTYAVIGNPPFGKISSLAVKFFNKAASFADVIAFIVPRTFKRVSIQNQLNLDFHLVFSEDLPLQPCCFEPAMSAKCCFQIWLRTDKPREIVIYNKKHDHFEFLKLGPLDTNKQPTPPHGADFAMKAYGGGCGQLQFTGLEGLRPKSWHWIKAKIDVRLLADRFDSLDYSMSKDTVRQDSIGQQEVIYLYEQKYGL